MFTFISFVFVFGLLVFFHEFGHFALAKMNNIKVHQFALGMGPKLISFKGKETEYSIRIFPIGGYVKMEGEDESSDDARSFSRKTPLQRISVLAAGPIMNIVLAILLFAIIAFNSGIPVNINIIGEVMENSPAEEYGLESGDKIVKINEVEINNWEDIVKNISESKEDIIHLKIIRNGKILYFDIKPTFDKESGRKILGISPTYEKSLISSVKVAVQNVYLAVKQIFDYLINLTRGKASLENIVGPVGMVQHVGEAARMSIFHLLFLAGIISINLAILNILPFPALDGGRIIFAIVELIKGSPIDPEKEGLVHMIGFIVLIALMVLVLVKDITRLNIF